MKKNQKLSLISSIIFFLLGLVIFLNPETIVKFASYCLGGMLLALGIYKSINYYIQDKRLNIVNRNELAFGITAIVLGIVFIFLADAIEFFTTDRNSKFYALIIVGIILIGIGLYIILISNLALSIIGLFMMIYGLIDFISYFIYKEKITDSIEENIVVVEEAEVEEKEDVEEIKKDKKKNKDKKNNQ